MALSPIEEIPDLIRDLYRIVGELERLFPDPRFTPDGHLVGSIGEVLAAHYYNIVLAPSSSKTHDGIAPGGKKVQVKATQGSSVGIRSEPDHLLVLKLFQDGRFEEVYNGPGNLPWDSGSEMQPNVQRAISVSKLRQLADAVPQEQRIQRRV
jgi:hypothetical protein